MVDEYLSLDNIRRVPVRFIAALSAKAITSIKHQYNLQAAPVAKLAVLVYKLGIAFMEGDSGEEPSIYDFLPFSDVADNKPRLSKKAKEVIRGLIREEIIGKSLIPIVMKHLN